MKVTVVVDAGVAPGLSNLLVARAKRLVDAHSAYVLVGSISRSPDSLLGIVPGWSVEDLLDEYVRPARMIKDGKLASIDPLEAEPGRIEVPAVGELEYVPTDGLRTLLYTLGDGMRNLVEYTLRWPGHYSVIRVFKRIGLLSERTVSVDGCPVRPKVCLARVLEHNLPKGDDMVVLIVVGVGEKESVRFQTVVLPRDDISAISLSTASFQVATALLVAEGLLKDGLFFPEQLGMRGDLSRRIIRFLEGRGIVVTEKFCRKLEECINPPPSWS
jgi:saccharopine dehydrogenase-like NADP-dependent oxidoreductase